LKKVIDLKTSKYPSLIRSLNLSLSKKIGKKRFEVEFLPFVISSLGALLDRSMTNLTKMMGTVT
jgi:hypothetical protein